MPPAGIAFEASYNLLHEPLIGWRDVALGDQHQGSLPEVLAALAADQVRDFPRLRPHQRHPWHAFLVQLAAVAMHRTGQGEPWHNADDWRAALRALTPDDPDDAPWCLVASPGRPALLQAPVPGENPATWNNLLHAADALDMLVTSKNHDLKAARARQAQADDWLFALISLQTQEGFLGAGNYGISKMNGGFASRPGVGVAALGHWGQRWQSDIASLLAQRDDIASKFGLASEDGHALLWLLPWPGTEALALASLDPFYIEICRRVRLSAPQGHIQAHTTGSKVARIAAKESNGVTGDAWTPIDTAKGKALTVSRNGFDYKLMSDLLTGDMYTQGAAWRIDGWPKDATLQAIAQVAVRGQGKTEGYHERRVPISPKLRLRMMGAQRPLLEKLARNRIQAIADMRKLLWNSLALLFANGENKRGDDAVNDRASRFAQPFEQQEDVRFFDDLTLQAEAEDAQQDAIYLQWLLGLAERAEAVLRQAFDAGPRSGMQRYKAQSAALSRFHAGLRGGKKPPFPELVVHYAALRTERASVSEGEAHV
ncbi:type I-E CRISPR-associated protein Cse1/CasA [Acidovorax sp. HDW3]|uniref:type I-E CRISPR-associated protein Cse1/CasA n=1 Tax=Acidovorax sp. HDW3 TaxID=2714923 RepID=UPI00140DB99E|nr:type I-E CRISPR-associated protein Cse1/CasA [Acidovorax sp. HDW3]QIL43601.1 type I-E CRISPR-associated protein Cse1/CasA [Acidovorax sp. HDW3]